MSAARSVPGADPLVAETAERLLAACCTPEAVEQAEADGWCPQVWDPLAEAGFPWISLPEERGGSGGSLADAMAVLRSAGRHCAPVPLAETAVLGGWLAAAAGFPVEGPASVVPDPAALHIASGRVMGEATVAWGARSSRILALVPGDQPLIVSARPGQLAVTANTNLAGEPRDVVRFDVPLSELEHAPAPEGVDVHGVRRRGCLSRIVLSAGALESLSQLTIDYAHGRHQFGRPIATFQAVQQHLVVVAQCAARAAMAADLAVQAFSAGDGSFEVAAARVIVDAAAADATRAAHQAHGAIGVTREYRLHQYSRRLWAWRHEYGAARHWRRQLGRSVAAGGAGAFFATVAR